MTAAATLAESTPLAADDAFFAALLAADRAALTDALADDFVLVDVMTGSEIPAPTLLDLVGSRQLRFEGIEPAERRARVWTDAAVVTGRTRMDMRFDGNPFTVASRYTHVFVRQGGRWRLASAQGTRIGDPPAAPA